MLHCFSLIFSRCWELCASQAACSTHTGMHYLVWVLWVVKPYAAKDQPIHCPPFQYVVLLLIGSMDFSLWCSYDNSHWLDFLILWRLFLVFHLQSFFIIVRRIQIEIPQWEQVAGEGMEKSCMERWVEGLWPLTCLSWCFARHLTSSLRSDMRRKCI